jgi:hypothetical protein
MCRQTRPISSASPAAPSEMRNRPPAYACLQLANHVCLLTFVLCTNNRPAAEVRSARQELHSGTTYVCTCSSRCEECSSGVAQWGHHVCGQVLVKNCTMGPPYMCACARQELQDGAITQCARNNGATTSNHGINVLPKTCALRFAELLFHGFTFYDYTHLACAR